jgi:hypothetical protein
MFLIKLYRQRNARQHKVHFYFKKYFDGVVYLTKQEENQLMAVQRV